MKDKDFLAAAMGELSPETRAAAAACAAAQLNLPHRITPGEVMKIADGLSAPRGPVLALMGWVQAQADRANRRAFFDVLVPRTGASEVSWPTDRETILGLAVCRTLQ
ncbi:hypothetical protein [Altererythrobacter lutimaris]|uniref:hypothetical protein n=1 Tax=Altererythrobacter lutimaris TaxID=2743979 RepID=UPI001593C84D|nr:hypothetical protein [Altererythrobacter lutimaris]